MTKNLVAIHVVFFLLASALTPTAGIYSAQSEAPDPDSVRVQLTGDAATLHVGGSGPGNYSSIQAAVDDARDGDTVFVYDDSSPYYESVFIDTSIHLLGERKNTTVIDGRKNTTVLRITADRARVSNCTIQHGGGLDDVGAGIHLAGDENTVSGTVIKDNLAGLVLTHASHNVVTRNVIAGNGWRGIQFLHSHHNAITGNHFHNNWEHAVELHIDSHRNTISCNRFTRDRPEYHNTLQIGSDEGRAAHTVIANNTFVGGGLTVESGNNNTVRDNLVNGRPLVYMENTAGARIDNAGQVILVNCTDITVENLHLSRLHVAVELVGSRRCCIRNNTVSGCMHGIALERSDDTVLSDNELVDDTVAIYLWFSQRNSVINNRLRHNNNGMRLFYRASGNVISGNELVDQVDAVTLTSICTGNLVRCNTIAGSAAGLTVTASPLNRVIHNTIRGSHDWGLCLAMSHGTVVCSNIFIENALHATFGSSRFTLCLRNYWDDWHMLLPRPIEGKYTAYDWCPRLLPAGPC